MTNRHVTRMSMWVERQEDGSDMLRYPTPTAPKDRVVMIEFPSGYCTVEDKIALVKAEYEKRGIEL